MFELNNLSLRRGAREVLSIRQLRLEKGQSTAIVGPNGAGKSTLLLALTGLLKPSQGHIRLDGQELKTWSGRELALRRAYLSQHFEMNASFSVAEVVNLGRGPHRTTTAQDRAVIAASLRAVGLNSFADRPYLNLSGGEKQRVHLARVLAQLDWGNPPPANQSRWALLDEPTASLDLGRRSEVLKVCQTLTRTGIGVIGVLHDLNHAAHYFDQLCLLDQGQLVDIGPPAKVLERSRLQAIYGTSLSTITDEQGRDWLIETE